MHRERAKEVNAVEDVHLSYAQCTGTHEFKRLSKQVLLISFVTVHCVFSVNSVLRTFSSLSPKSGLFNLFQLSACNMLNRMQLRAYDLQTLRVFRFAVFRSSSSFWFSIAIIGAMQCLCVLFFIS